MSASASSAGSASSRLKRRADAIVYDAFDHTTAIDVGTIDRVPVGIGLLVLRHWVCDIAGPTACEDSYDAAVRTCAASLGISTAAVANRVFEVAMQYGFMSLPLGKQFTDGPQHRGTKRTVSPSTSPPRARRGEGGQSPRALPEEVC